MSRSVRDARRSVTRSSKQPCGKRHAVPERARIGETFNWMCPICALPTLTMAFVCLSCSSQGPLPHVHECLYRASAKVKHNVYGRDST